jgi:serine/threonine protein kinase
MKVSGGLDPTSIAYMQKEIEILRSLNSDKYPKLLYNNIFTEHPESEQKLSERLFVTIEERVDAVPLTDLKGTIKTEKQVAGLLLKLVNALEPLWMHKQKLVHRDLKPDNILLKPNGDVTIVDLGILRETGAPGVTSSHAMFGPLSPAYASPEQASNKKDEISYKSDFFALGTICYELASGVSPFVPKDELGVLEILENVRKLEPAELQTVCKVSPEFASLIARMMAKEPYKRHRTVDVLRKDIEAFC